MSRTAAFPFAADEVVIARDGFLTALNDGQEVIVKLGSRHRSSEPIVRLRPELFSRDGDPFDQVQGLEQPDPEPPAPKVKPKMLRVRKAFASGNREIPGAWGVPEKFKLTLHADSLVRADWAYLKALSKSEMREFFEEVVDP